MTFQKKCVFSFLLGKFFKKILDEILIDLENKKGGTLILQENPDWFRNAWVDL
jgi:hypothetical protein